MIGSGLKGADLENRVASWATSDDAAAVPAVIEAYGHRLAAADVAGVVSQYAGNAAMCQLDAGAVEGAAPASSESSTWLRARSEPLAFAEHDAAPATQASTCPYRGRAGRRRRSRSRPCACSWGAGAAGGHSSRPPMH